MSLSAFVGDFVFCKPFLDHFNIKLIAKHLKVINVYVYHSDNNTLCYQATVGMSIYDILALDAFFKTVVQTFVQTCLFHLFYGDVEIKDSVKC